MEIVFRNVFADERKKRRLLEKKKPQNILTIWRRNIKAANANTASSVNGKQRKTLVAGIFVLSFFWCTVFCRSWKLAPERDKDAIFFQLPYEKCQVEETHVQTAEKSFREHPISAGRIYGFLFSFLFFKVSRIPVNITQSRCRTFCTEWLTAHTHHWGSK